MSLPVLYSSIAVINREKDRAMRVIDGNRTVGFARGTHLLPALTQEFFAAARELPIVFVMTEGQPSPVFVVGLQFASNAFVRDDGKWKARYVPAYLRRYPFILADVGGPESVICIDGGYDGSVEDGDALFDENGTNSPYLDGAIGFVKNYFDAARQTEAFTALLVKHALLKTISVEVKDPDGTVTGTHDFLAVDEAKVTELSSEAYLELRAVSAIPLIYAHLFSLASFANVSDKVQEMAALAPVVASTSEEPGENHDEIPSRLN